MCVYACVQTLRQHLQQENMKKAILGSGIDLQTAVGIIGGGFVPPTTPEIIQEAFKNVSTSCGVCVCMLHATRLCKIRGTSPESLLCGRVRSY